MLDARRQASGGPNQNPSDCFLLLLPLPIACSSVPVVITAPIKDLKPVRRALARSSRAGLIVADTPNHWPSRVGRTHKDLRSTSSPHRKPFPAAGRSESSVVPSHVAARCRCGPSRRSTGRTVRGRARTVRRGEGRGHPRPARGAAVLGLVEAPRSGHEGCRGRRPRTAWKRRRWRPGARCLVNEDLGRVSGRPARCSPTSPALTKTTATGGRRG